MGASRIFRRLTELLDTSISGEANDDFVQRKAGAWTNRTVAQVKTDLGVSSADSPQFTAINLGHASDTTFTRSAAGVAMVEGNLLFTQGKTVVDVLQAAEFAADAGANDTYVATLSPAPSAYVTGCRYRFKANTANTGACTVNFNSLGAIAIKKVAGGITTDPADNDIRAGQWVELCYDGTNMQILSSLGNSASATPGGSDTYVQLNVSSAFGGVAGLTANTTTGALTQSQTSLGTTTAAGVTVTNTTAAAAGAQQVSPATVWTGNGWKTNATAASQAVDFRAYVLPVQGASAPTGKWILQHQINGGGYTTAVSIDSAGSPDQIVSTSSYLCLYNFALAVMSGRCSLRSGGVFGWSNNSGDPTSTLDLILSRPAAATLQQGAADASSPVAQTTRVQSVVAGTSNTAGATWTHQGSLSTGSGAGGAIQTKTSLSEAAATTQNSATVRNYISAKWVNLTESTATLFCNIALGASKILGARLICTVYADDATDFQALTSEVTIQAVNKAGTVTAAISQADSTTAASSGTLTATYTIVANGNGVDIKCDAASSLTQTTLRIMWQIVALNSNDTAAVTAS